MNASTIQPTNYRPSLGPPKTSLGAPFLVATPRKTAVLTSLDAYYTGLPNNSRVTSSLPSDESATGWKTLGQVLLASLVGVPVGLMAGEWAWRQRPHSLAKKLEENKQAFLTMIKNPLSEDQLNNIGKIGGLIGTYNELVGMCKKNNELLQLELPNVVDNSSKFSAKVGNLLREKEVEALKLYELEQLLEVDEAKLLRGDVIDENSVKSPFFIAEPRKKGVLTWLRKSEKELLTLEIAGYLAKAARQSKLIAATLAGGIIGMGVVLLNLGHRHTVQKEQQVALIQQEQLTLATLPQVIKHKPTVLKPKAVKASFSFVEQAEKSEDLSATTFTNSNEK